MLLEGNAEGELAELRRQLEEKESRSSRRGKISVWFGGRFPFFFLFRLGFRVVFMGSCFFIPFSERVVLACVFEFSSALEVIIVFLERVESGFVLVSASVSSHHFCILFLCLFEFCGWS